MDEEECVVPLPSEEDEMVASEYRKMLRIGVPRHAVRKKMEREGVRRAIVEALLGEGDAAEDEDGAVGVPVATPQPSDIAMPDECTTSFELYGATVDPRNPTLAWEAHLKDKLPQVERVDTADSGAAVHTGERELRQGYSRWVCISDTHGAHTRMANQIPGGDVLIHAGDFSRMGGTKELELFCEWMASLPHRYKIVIAGNHEVTLDAAFNGALRRSRATGKEGSNNAAREMIRSCKAFTYLEDSSAKVLGYNVYGSPWQPEFCNWAFNLPRGRECAAAWSKIPTDTDVLVTHGPPVGHGDLCSNGLRAGCVDLLAEVLQRVKPSHHIFGHIHEGYGCTRTGDTLFLNASTCTFRYRPSNPPLVFDLPMRCEH